MLVIYYVHPPIDRHIWVTRDYQYGKKKKRMAAFQIDMPGRWFEDEYNCHVDGCDYACKDLDEALKKGAEVLKNIGDEYEFIHTNDEFDFYKDKVIFTVIKKIRRCI